MTKKAMFTACLSATLSMAAINANAQWSLSGAGATGTISTPGNVSAGGNITALGNKVYLRNDGETRFHLYNGGGQAEWLMGQKSLANSSFILSKKVAAAETDFINIYPSGRMHIDGPELLYLLNQSGVIVSKSWGGNGNLTVEGNLIVPAAASSYVQIGTSTAPYRPGYRLFVDQGILTEKVKVAVAGSAQWSDYVFAKDYNLMPLDEVEQFVKKNKHLPNVPSADEMVKEGNDLGKTDAKLLEKIEELTLYVIELNRRCDLQAKEIAALKR
jgi:hypothetical protein